MNSPAITAVAASIRVTIGGRTVVVDGERGDDDCTAAYRSFFLKTDSSGQVRRTP